ncbi:hypothetical protein [Moheibacter lacus]|uniref:Uncharacterized protein n=1 Tax=Moheibacter lacus TaxID=2745851 RepID=A0A838ZLY4_9FLAO|nr:hypothetical protein [Moheibacter lacus]MBA5629514.1 hypothetical protein [Moheibacter lacus]
MKIPLILIFLLFGTNSLIAQECIFLPDGKYKVLPNKEFPHYNEYLMEIRGDEFISHQDSLQVFKIVKNYCFFKLENTDLEEDDFTELDKMLNEQSLGYKILRSEKGIYDFVLYSISLKGQVYSGKFIRIEDEN